MGATKTEVNMFSTHSQILRVNGRAIMGKFGSGSEPTYFIYNTRSGDITNTGKRKHIVEMWNTRYAYGQTRTYNAEG